MTAFERPRPSPLITCGPAGSPTLAVVFLATASAILARALAEQRQRRACTSRSEARDDR